MPFGRHAARVVRSLVEHPAPLAVARHEIKVAEGVLAHLPAVAPTVQQRADGRAVPPGADLADDAHGRRVYRHAPALRTRDPTCRRPRHPDTVEGRFTDKGSEALRVVKAVCST